MTTMQVGLTLPMGDHRKPPASWSAIRAFAQRAEALGFDSLWAFDHVLFRLPEREEAGAHEAWTVLSAVAAATERLTLGTLVMGLRLRNPALLAKMAVTLDEISGGRLILGVGAGWHDPEYDAFGYPLHHRLGRTEEALRILTGLLRGERVTFEGRWLSASDAVILPPPARRIPVLSAGRRGRMMRLVAAHADLANIAWLGHPDDPIALTRRSELEAACREIRRDPGTLVMTAGVSVRYPDAESPGPLGAAGGDLAGDPDQIAAGLSAFAAAGYAHAIVWLEPMTVDSVDRFAEAVARFRSAAAPSPSGSGR